MFGIIFGGIVLEIVVVAAILLILLVMLKFGNIVVTLILNSILGLVVIWLANSFFMLGIMYDWITWIAVAILGLPGVAAIILLKLLGISI